MLTAAELTAMQAVQATTLTEPCSIVRRTLASDGAGGQTETASASPSVCRVAPSMTHLPADRLIAGSTQDQVLWRITLPAGTTVQSADRINVGERSFEVKGLYGPATLGTALVCVCVER